MKKNYVQTLKIFNAQDIQISEYYKYLIKKLSKIIFRGHSKQLPKVRGLGSEDFLFNSIS